MSMANIKIQQCREHYNHLAPHVKDRATAKHFLALMEIAEVQQEKINRMEMELRELRPGNDD